MAEFTGNRHITCGIRNEIPIELQTIMWDMIDEDRDSNKKLDYLQVFELKPKYTNGTGIQEIIHSQEQPCRKKKVTVESDDPIYSKIFVIDDISHSTMLLNHEY